MQQVAIIIILSRNQIWLYIFRRIIIIGFEIVYNQKHPNGKRAHNPTPN